MGELERQDKPSYVSKLGAIRRPRLSPEQKKFNRTRRCARCGDRMLNPAYSMPDGTPVTPKTLRKIVQGSLVGGLLTAGPAAPVGMLAAVKRHYAITTEDEQTFEEEIELTVPPRTSVQLCLHWKRLWQEGYAIMRDAGDQTISIPYRTVIGVTFDQESIDT